MTATAFIRASIAPMHAEPRVSSVQISQRLAGHAVTLLETQDDWNRVRGEDGYEGWIHRGYLDLTDAGARCERLSLGCVVGRGEQRRALPLGAWVAEGEYVASGEVVDAEGRLAAFPREPRAIVRSAIERFAGAPYQWGGVSPWGADCSGIVQTVFWLHGVLLPRDAWQQAEVGVEAGADVDAWSAADLIFFTDRPDRRITHVGIAAGESRMVHLALGRGGYAVERLDARDDPYVASLMTRFVVARRLL